ncbi:MAG: hypothetical protein NC337_14320 [Roseburia sp.]|nr:hypothetical protein [Roseburia sp.]
MLMDEHAFETWRNGLLKGVTTSYSEILRIEQRMQSLMQQAVNMDVKHSGRVSEITMKVADAYGFEILEGFHTVIEKQEQADVREEQKPAQPAQKKEARYVTYVETPANETIPVIEGDDLEALFQKWQEIENGRGEGNKLRNVCVIDSRPGNGRPYEAYRYEIETGKDVTPIYLSLPQMSEAEQAQTALKLREAGAKFNERSNGWYVTRDQDLSSFEPYLKGRYTEELRSREREEKKQNRSDKEEKVMAEKFYSYAYNKDGSVSRLSEAGSLEEVTARWQKIEAGRDKNNKLGHFYVRAGDPETGKTEVSRYEITTGKDVTPVYLHLPEMGREEFAETVLQLKEAGAKFSGTRKEWYVTRDMDLSRFEQYMKPAEPGKQVNAYAYNKDGSTVRISGDSFEEVLGAWRKLDAERGGDNKLGYFYLKTNNPETGKTEAGRYEIATGKDVTPVYLHIPPMGREKFAETVQYLKDNGAKFNGVKMAWYVTKNMDMGKFQQYLKAPETEKKGSTIAKLNDYRKAASGQPQHSAEEKKQEAVR